VAASALAPLQFRVEQSAVAALMRTELLKFGNHIGRGESCHQYLAGIDADRTMLTRMIYLDDAVTHPLLRDGLRNEFH
jgi:hypothetical protein